MDERKRNWITWAFVLLTVAAVVVMLGGTLRRTTHVTLPAPGSGVEQNGGEETGRPALSVVSVTPETVQSAIATLARPDAYRRTVTLEQIWSGGSGTVEVEVSVRDGWTRTDKSLPGGQVRHAVTDGEETYIWYDGEKTAFTVPAGDISADDEQGIPTYEDVLELPEETIAAADHRMISGMDCIYVETAADSDGYVLRYLVELDTGLLAAAEKLLDGAAVYRMAAQTADQTAPPASAFTLPDGRALLEL